jgi:hypothetical protein
MTNLTLDADTPDTIRLSVNVILTRSKKIQKNVEWEEDVCFAHLLL